MAENAPALKLDKAGLQKFLTEDITPFLAAIKAMREDGWAGTVWVPGIPNLQGGEDGAKAAAGFLDGQQAPLAIGTMASDAKGRINGGYLISCLNKLVDEIDAILKLQVTLFEEIEDNLAATFDKVLKAQGDSLEKVDGKKFVDFFKGVDEVLTEGSGGSSSGKTT